MSRPPLSPAREQPSRRPAVVWHELECGAYTADLPLWRRLAGPPPRAPGAGGWILDVGCGSGRVALDLARAGHAVCAVDRDRELLAALAERGAGLPLQTVCADARELSLARRDFRLCVVPMQTVQLLGGRHGRLRFMRAARAHLRRGALLAAAIVTDVDVFDCAAGDAGPSAETTTLDGVRYVSRATRVAVHPSRIVIERRRSAGGPRAPVERDVVELDRVGAAELADEGAEAGFAALEPLEIAPTEEHLGSTVVMLRA